MSVSYEEAMATLCSMFSSFDRSVIDLILHQNGGHMEKTVETLLALAGSEQSQSPSQQSAPSHSPSPAVPIVPNQMHNNYPSPQGSASASASGYPNYHYPPPSNLPAGFYDPNNPHVPSQGIYPPPNQYQPHPPPGNNFFTPYRDPLNQQAQAQAQAQPSRNAGPQVNDNMLPHDFLRPPSYFRAIVSNKVRNGNPQSQGQSPQVAPANIHGSPNPNSIRNQQEIDEQLQFSMMLQDQEFMEQIQNNPQIIQNNKPNNNPSASAASSVPGPSTQTTRAASGSLSGDLVGFSNESGSAKKKTFADKWNSLTNAVQSRFSSLASKFKRDKVSSNGNNDSMEAGSELVGNYQALPSIDDEKPLEIDQLQKQKIALERLSSDDSIANRKSLSSSDNKLLINRKSSNLPGFGSDNQSNANASSLNEDRNRLADGKGQGRYTVDYLDSNEVDDDDNNFHLSVEDNDLDNDPDQMVQDHKPIKHKTSKGDLVAPLNPRKTKKNSQPSEDSELQLQPIEIVRPVASDSSSKTKFVEIPDL